MNLLQRIKYEAIKLAVEAYLQRKLGKQAMANPITTQVIAFITQFVSTGDATLGPINLTESQTVKIGNENIQITETESLTVEAKKV